MERLSFLLDIISTFSEIFCMYHYAEILFDHRLQGPFRGRHNQWYIVPPVVLSALLTPVLNRIVLTSPYLTLVVMIQSVLTLWALWQCRLFDAAAVIGAYLFALTLSGNIEISVTGLIGGEELIYRTTMVQGRERVIYLILLSPYWFAVNMLFSGWLKKRMIRPASLCGISSNASGRTPEPQDYCKRNRRAANLSPRPLTDCRPDRKQANILNFS